MINEMDTKGNTIRDSRREENFSRLTRAIDRTYKKLAQGHVNPEVIAAWEQRLARQEKELARLCNRNRFLLRP